MSFADVIKAMYLEFESAGALNLPKKIKRKFVLKPEFKKELFKWSE